MYAFYVSIIIPFKIIALITKKLIKLKMTYIYFVDVRCTCTATSVLKIMYIACTISCKKNKFMINTKLLHVRASYHLMDSTQCY